MAESAGILDFQPRPSNMPIKILSTRATLAATLAGASLLTGCASIVNGQNQVVSVETRNKGEMVPGANCELNNGKGKFYVTTPGTVTVQRAYDDMNVKCEKSSLPPGVATVMSSTKAMAFGNILLGGIIGAAVDVGTGAAYDYPSLITVMMGESILIQPNPPEPVNAQQATSLDSAAPTAPAPPVAVTAIPN